MGLLKVAQEDLQWHRNIDWTATRALDIDNIIQEVINLKDSKLERQRFLHSTYAALTPKDETHEALHEIR